MKKREKKKGVSRWKILLLGILVIALVILIFSTYTKDCGEDKACFDDTFSRCVNSQYTHYEDGNRYLYEIKGSKIDYCIMTVYMDEMGMDVDDNVKNRLEGKGMVCEVDESTDIYNTKELSVSCTGPLKEALLQMTVERLYGFVVKTFGEGMAASVDIPYSVLKG